ncbi:hypothetical protein [Dictyobacter kobayashii]|uniref:Uncharacterized protein n=1 Tax=Dictyobacter kobayashii TaxID=2014872 RepID=A0A402AHT2_9CHLR|nr:hypothetical protein [Dictyobacter kobayashii]GCE18678.1 hypothetical protein KDK_24780 [Dictyobacter kobayashii]
MMQTSTLEGFCQTCPDPQEVAAMLEPLGLSLQFQSAVSISYSAPYLPAQYHYQGAQGTEVIFLAGKDTPENGTRFPPHRSRWWIYRGASHYAFNLVAQEIAARWGIDWLDNQESAQHSVA